MSESIFYPCWQETLILCSEWWIPHKHFLTCWTHCLPTHYTVPQFENHDRWKVNRFFHCLTPNDRPQTSSNLAPYSGPAMLGSSDLEIQAQDRVAVTLVWLMCGPSSWQASLYRGCNFHSSVCLYEFVCVLVIKWNYNLSLAGSCDKSIKLKYSTYQ